MMKPLLGLVGVLIAAMASEFNDQVSSVTLPDISGGLALSHDPGTWFASLYLSAQVLGMALSPWLLVTFTLRQFTLFVLLLNASSSVLIPFAHDLSALYTLRIAQGLSGGLTIPLLMTTRTVQNLGDGDGSGMTSHVEAGWESMDGVGAAAGRDGR
jgi:DHA2 family multidrug resistance protein